MHSMILPKINEVEIVPLEEMFAGIVEICLIQPYAYACIYNDVRYVIIKMIAYY